VRAAVPDELDFVLAGGLRPDNVARAVALLRPDVVDVSSGIETAPRQKAPELVRAFIDAVRMASRSLRQDDEPSGQSSASDDLDYA
jgi:phosphoribosylanthranilate isomerase